MKYIYSIVVLVFLMSQSVYAQSEACRFYETKDMAKIDFYKDSPKTSIGWIYCDHKNFGSLVYEKVNMKRILWIQKYLKQALPDLNKFEVKSQSRFKFGDRVVTTSFASGEKIQHLFLFEKTSGKWRTFSVQLPKKAIISEIKIITGIVKEFLTNPRKLKKHRLFGKLK